MAPSLYCSFSLLVCVSNGHRLKGAWHCQTVSPLLCFAQTTKTPTMRPWTCLSSTSSWALAWVLELNTHLLSVALTTKTQRKEKVLSVPIAHFFLVLVSQKSFCIRNSSRASHFFLSPISLFSHSLSITHSLFCCEWKCPSEDSSERHTTTYSHTFTPSHCISCSLHISLLNHLLATLLPPAQKKDT